MSSRKTRDGNCSWLTVCVWGWSLENSLRKLKECGTFTEFSKENSQSCHVNNEQFPTIHVIERTSILSRIKFFVFFALQLKRSCFEKFGKKRKYCQVRIKIKLIFIDLKLFLLSLVCRWPDSLGLIQIGLSSTADNRFKNGVGFFKCCFASVTGD